MNCAYLMTISIVLKVMFFTVQYVLLEQIICDIKRGEGGGGKVNATMTLRIMILICEQSLIMGQ